ncbi:3'-5' exonuclease, PolB [Gloeomargarita lithophora Alchichica-D10]|uniref:3'-5' exonuclease, PolB n=1 Tax=Gloeomargarita lithophora Alchichica-D10 TaxID=1188229 RepID=A0A1J0AA76_9CYAN|nr:ribonuclease H-like domain-containing protein [Gloeomargarita lithophora]APB32831.1 3'-5' exonuclease, PolB [Gloeomargarita lithophora Alchichica-D10]
MFTQSQIEKLLFIDIETASNAPQFQDLSPKMQGFWERKARQYYKISVDEEFDVSASYLEKAGIFAEFNRVVCVCFGYIRWEKNAPAGTFKTFYNQDEKQVLLDTAQTLNQPKSSQYQLCGHNIKEFDTPVLARRMLIHGVQPLPKSLNNYGKKPWEVKHLDTLELWKFGDFKNFTSLDLLTHLLHIPSPKGDMDGAQVGVVFWQEQNLEKIAQYCQKDVQATMNLILRLSNMPLIQDEETP